MHKTTYSYGKLRIAIRQRQILTKLGDISPNNAIFVGKKQFLKNESNLEIAQQFFDIPF